MMNLTEMAARYGTQEACLRKIEAMRWPDGVRCPRCGADTVTRLKGRPQFTCAKKACRYRFSVTAGTIFHKTRIPLPKWFMGVYMILTSRKGYAARQFSRDLDIRNQTAWSMMQRIRKAMANGDTRLAGIVECDETYLKVGKPVKVYYGPKQVYREAEKATIFGMRERKGHTVLQKVADNNGSTLLPAIEGTVEPMSTVMTDEWQGYKRMSRKYRHQTVCHKKEWVAPDGTHINGQESVFAIIKRGHKGIYHHLTDRYLQRYLDEISFRLDHKDRRDAFDLLLSRCERGYDAEKGSANPSIPKEKTA